MIQFDEQIFSDGSVQPPTRNARFFRVTLLVGFIRDLFKGENVTSTWVIKGSLGRSWWLVGYQQISNTNTRCFKHFSEIYVVFPRKLRKKHVRKCADVRGRLVTQRTNVAFMATIFLLGTFWQISRSFFSIHSAKNPSISWCWFEFSPHFVTTSLSQIPRNLQQDPLKGPLNLSI